MGQVLSYFNHILNNANDHEGTHKRDDEIHRTVWCAEISEAQRRVSRSCSTTAISIIERLKIDNCTTNEALLLQQQQQQQQQQQVSLPIKRVLTATVMKPPERWIMHYCSSHKILTVGDGDFSFSACLAKAFGCADNMRATSLNDIGFLVKNYENSLENIYELKRRGCTVIHCVDATEMADHYLLGNLKFDRIVFNFPLAGFFRDESRQSQISRNQKLVLAFLSNAKKMIKKDGEIHISHKSMGFFLEWNLEFLAMCCGLRLKEEVEFDLDDYPGYQNKYGYGGDKNFNCNPSKTYKFVLQH